MLKVLNYKTWMKTFIGNVYTVSRVIHTQVEYLMHFCQLGI